MHGCFFCEVQLCIRPFNKDVQPGQTAQHLPVDYRLPEGGEGVQPHRGAYMDVYVTAVHTKTQQRLLFLGTVVLLLLH